MVYARGSGPDVDTVPLTPFTAAPSRFLTNGRLIPTLHAATHPTQHFNAQARIDPTFYRQATFLLQDCSPHSPRASSLPHWFSANKKTSVFLPQLWQHSRGWGYLSLAFIYSAAGATQPTLSINIFAWHSVWSNRKQRLQYIYTSKLGENASFENTRQAEQKRVFQSVGLSEAAMWAAGCGLEDRQLSSRRFHQAGFPELLSSLVISSF